MTTGPSSAGLQPCRSGFASRFGSLARRLAAAIVGLTLCAHSAAMQEGAASGRMRVPEPDLTDLEASVQAHLRNARAEFLLLAQRSAGSDEALAQAYGRLGRLYHAHHLDHPAEACYRNAQLLEPSDFRWPYLLAVLYQRSARLHQAAKFYRQALVLRPDAGVARLRLAQVLVDLDRHDEAEPLLKRTLAADGLRGAVSFELGKVALARRDFAQAVEWLEQARREQPQASRIHYPLAMAYRGVGDVPKAKEFIGRRGDVKPNIPDPLVDGLTELVSGARPHIYRANKAALARQYEEAAQGFRVALKLDPDNVPARVRLGRTLYLLGDRAGARRELETALRRDSAPENEAHFYMGLLLEEDGLDEAALAHYRATIASDPRHPGAHLQSANVMMRLGRYDEAANYYAEFVRYVPHHLPGRLMEVLALARAGDRYKEAREKLEKALAAYPGDPVLTQALVRILAASPDDSVRDGARALESAKLLYQRYGGPEAAEALSMAYAERGDFSAAIAAQEQAMALALWAGRADLADRLRPNLQRYREGLPCRTPWAADDPIFIPPPGDTTRMGT